MALQKTYSESDQIGEEGQRLVTLTVTRLGHIWQDQRVDHGVDGEIELVDPLRRWVFRRIVRTGYGEAMDDDSPAPVPGADAERAGLERARVGGNPCTRSLQSQGNLTLKLTYPRGLLA